MIGEGNQSQSRFGGSAPFPIRAIFPGFPPLGFSEGGDGHQTSATGKIQRSLSKSGFWSGGFFTGQLSLWGNPGSPWRAMGRTFHGFTVPDAAGVREKMRGACAVRPAGQKARGGRGGKIVSLDEAFYCC